MYFLTWKIVYVQSTQQLNGLKNKLKRLCSDLDQVLYDYYEQLPDSWTDLKTQAAASALTLIQHWNNFIINVRQHWNIITMCTNWHMVLSPLMNLQRMKLMAWVELISWPSDSCISLTSYCTERPDDDDDTAVQSRRRFWLNTFSFSIDDFVFSWKLQRTFILAVVVMKYVSFSRTVIVYVTDNYDRTSPWQNNWQRSNVI